MTRVHTGRLAGRRLSDAAYERIRRLIITCEISPGAQVTEAELVDRCAGSKAAVRAALMRLAQEDLVKPLARRGYVVSSVTLQDCHDIFEFRLLLEPAAAAGAAGKIDPDRLDKLDAICRVGYTPGDRASEAKFLLANRAFHLAIAEASGQERLTRALAQLLDEMERLLHLGLALRDRSTEMGSEHRALIDALAAGDGAAAARIAREQIETAREMVLRGLLASPNLLAVNLGANAGAHSGRTRRTVPERRKVRACAAPHQI